MAEIIQRVRPDILLLQEFDYDAAGASLAAFQANYLGTAAGRRRTDSLRVYVLCRVQHRRTFRLRSRSRRAHCRRRRRTRDSVNFPGSTPWCCCRVSRSTRHAVRTFRKFLWRDMPGALLPDDPATRCARRLVFARAARGAAVVVEVALGRAGAYRPVHLAPAGQSSDAAVFRRAGGSQRAAQSRRDPLVDRLSERARRYLRDDDGRSAASTGKTFVIMGDQNSDPGRRRQPARRHRRDCCSIRGSTRSSCRKAPARIEASAAAGWRERRAARRSALRHRRLQRPRRRQPARGLSAAVEGAARVRRRRVLAAPGRSAVEAGGDPPPSSDHRLVWLDISADAARCPPGSDPTASAGSHPGR